MKDRAEGLAALQAERERLAGPQGKLPLDAHCEYAAALLDADLVDEVIHEAHTIIRLAEAAGDQVHLARGHLTLGVYHWRLGELRQAANRIHKAREVCPPDHPRIAASIEEADGLICKAQGDLPRAAECLMRARDFAAESELALQQVRISINLVSILQNLGDAQAALEEGLNARSRLADAEDHRSLFILAYNLCASYMSLGRHDDALAEAETARHYQESAKVEFARVGLDVMFAQVHAELDNRDAAREAADRLRAIEDANFAPHSRLEVLAQVGGVYHRIGALADADACFERAFAQGVSEGEEATGFRARLARLELWLDSGRFAAAHRELAELADDEAVDRTALARLLSLRARVAAAHSDFEHAFEFERRRSRTLEALADERADRELRNLQVLHRVKHERAVRAALERSNEELTTQVREQTQALERAQRLEALGRLAGGVAHDFSNLLTVLGGGTQLVEAELSRSAKHRALVQEMKAAVQRGSRLAERLLAFGSRVELSLAPRPVEGVLDNMRFLLVRLVGDRVELGFHDELTDAERKAQIAVDEPQLDAVLMNLALNARDAMPGGGRLDFTLRVRDGQLEIEVADTGSGVPDSIAASLFEPFATTKETVGGIGLGLSSSLGIVRKMGGTLELVETSAAGTRFVVRLPLAESEPVVTLEPKGGVELRGRHALVVEDDAAVRGIIASFLRHLGMEVAEADDGEDAYERLAAGAEPDILVCDVSMPRCTGPELVERLRAEGRMQPVLFVSGWHGRHLSLDPANDPTLDFLEKPIDIGELGRRLRALLEETQAVS